MWTLERSRWPVIKFDIFAGHHKAYIAHPGVCACIRIVLFSLILTPGIPCMVISNGMYNHLGEHHKVYCMHIYWNVHTYKSIIIQCNIVCHIWTLGKILIGDKMHLVCWQKVDPCYHQEGVHAFIFELWYISCRHWRDCGGSNKIWHFPAGHHEICSTCRSYIPDGHYFISHIFSSSHTWKIDAYSGFTCYFVCYCHYWFYTTFGIMIFIAYQFWWKFELQLEISILWYIIIQCILKWSWSLGQCNMIIHCMHAITWLL